MKVKKAKEYVLRLLMLPLLAVVLFTSCARHSASWPQLLEAEHLLDTDLPAAAALIDSVDASPLRGEDAALYAILKTQVDYKRYIPLTSDSLPRVATDYYGTPYRKNYRAAMAWYSLGCYYTEKKDDVQAIGAYLKAKDCFPDTTIRYYALTEQNLGRHYLSKNMPDEALQEFNRCKDYFSLRNKHVSVLNIQYEQARCYLCKGKMDTADTLYQEILQDKEVTQGLRQKCAFELTKIAYLRGNNQTAKNFLLEYFPFSNKVSYTDFPYKLYGDIYRDENHYDSAYYFYHKSLQHPLDRNTLCALYGQLAEVSSFYGNVDSVRYYLMKHDLLADSLFREHNSKEISAVSSSHALELVELKEKMKRLYTHLLWGIGTSLSIFIIFLLAKRSQIRKKTSYLERMNELEAKIHVLNNELLSVSDNQSLAKSDTVDDGAMVSFTAEDSLLCQMIETYRDMFVERHGIVHKALLERNASLEFSAEERQHFLKCIEVSFAELILAILRKYPKTNKEELLSAICAMLGYKTKIIADLLVTTPSNLRSRKCRLQNKISDMLYDIFYSDGKTEE